MKITQLKNTYDNDLGYKITETKFRGIRIHYVCDEDNILIISLFGFQDYYEEDRENAMENALVKCFIMSLKEATFRVVSDDGNTGLFISFETKEKREKFIKEMITEKVINEELYELLKEYDSYKDAEDDWSVF